MKTRWQIIINAAEDIDQLNYFMSIEQKRDIRSILEYHKQLNIVIIETLLRGIDDLALTYIEEMHRSIEIANKYIKETYKHGIR